MKVSQCPERGNRVEKAVRLITYFSMPFDTMYSIMNLYILLSRGIAEGSIETTGHPAIFMLLQTSG